MIDPEAELILIDGFVVDAPVVVCGPGARRQRIPFEERASHWIHPLHGNRVGRERTAGRGAACAGNGRCRIVNRRHTPGDGFGEHALALEQRRHRGDHRAPDRLPLALIVEEEERLIAANGPADDATELIAAKLRLDRVGRREEVPRIQRFVSKELKGGAVKRVAPGLGGQVHHTAVEAPELGWRTVGFDLELLNGVDVRKECHLPRLGLQHGDAVEQVFVGPGPSAVDARQRSRGRRRQRHAGHQTREGDEAPAVERQVDDLSVVDDLAKP